MKALVGAFNQEKALVGAFSVIVKTGCGITDGELHSTNAECDHVTCFPAVNDNDAHFNKVCPGHTPAHLASVNTTADKCRIKAVPVKHASRLPPLAYLVLGSPDVQTKFEEIKIIMILNTSQTSSVPRPLSFSDIISDTRLKQDWFLRFWHLSAEIVEETKN